MPTPVLFVDHAPALGGAEICLLLACELLDRKRFAAHLATQPGRLAEAARKLGVIVHELPLRRLRRTPTAPWRFARGVLALMRVIRRERIALVYVNTVRAGVCAAPAARLTGRPVLWHVHDIFSPGMYTRVMANLADATIAVSKAAAEPLPRADKVRVIYPGVRLEDFQGDRREQAAALREAWGVPPEAVLIGQVARLQPWKGQRDVIAAAELLGDLPAAYVAIIGGDIFEDAQAYERELKTMARTRGLAARLIFAGHREDVPATLQALDILVHASDREAFGRILIEAGAAGLPVVAYDSGAVREIVKHETTGLLVPAGDRAGLAAALRCLVNDPARARVLGDNARKEVRARFDMQRLTRDIERVIGDVLNAH